MRSGPNDDPRASPEFDAVILAGGRAARLDGHSKPDVLVGGRRLLDHALDAVTNARRAVVVGPPGLAAPRTPTTLSTPTAPSLSTGPQLLTTQEDPPRGGPVAGIDAGLSALDRGANLAGEAAAQLVLILACDIPSAGRVVGRLVAAAAQDLLAGGDGAQLIDAGGRAQPLLAVYRRTALMAALSRLASSTGIRDASLRELLSETRLRSVVDREGDADDADTWPDVARLDAVHAARLAAERNSPPQ